MGGVSDRVTGRKCIPGGGGRVCSCLRCTWHIKHSLCWCLGGVQCEWILRFGQCGRFGGFECKRLSQCMGWLSSWRICLECIKYGGNRVPSRAKCKRIVQCRNRVPSCNFNHGVAECMGWFTGRCKCDKHIKQRRNRLWSRAVVRWRQQHARRCGSRHKLCGIVQHGGGESRWTVSRPKHR